MADFRNFIGENQTVMNQIKPLDQVLSIEADAHNQITKVVNKFGSRGSILYRLKEFYSSIPNFRRSGKGHIRHRLDDIIMLIILGRASGCIGRAQIIEFGKYNLDKFRKMGKRFDGYQHLVVMLFGILKHFDFLRKLEIGMKTEAHKLGHHGMNYWVRRSTLADSLRSLASGYYTQIGQ